MNGLGGFQVKLGRLAFPGDGFNHYRYKGHIPVATMIGGFDFLNLLNNGYALRNLCKNAVTMAITRFGLVKEIVVFAIDEKLTACRVGLGQPGHGQGSLLVFQTIGRLVGYICPGCFLFHVGGETTPLNHEIGNHPVKNGPIKKLVVHILEEICHGSRGKRILTFDNDVPMRGFHPDFGIRHFYVSLIGVI